MDKEIAWRVRLAVKPGQLDGFRALTGEMVAAARRETGVLGYQRFVSVDGTVVELYERYADSAAALAHLDNFAAQFAARFAGMVERTQFIVFGAPDDALRRRLEGYGATFFRHLGEFPYWA